MVPPSDVCWFINPMNTIVISTINHSEMGVICTNLANELGHHLVEKNMERSTMLNRWVNQHFYHFDMGHVQWFANCYIVYQRVNHDFLMVFPLHLNLLDQSSRLHLAGFTSGVSLPASWQPIRPWCPKDSQVSKLVYKSNNLCSW